MQLFTLTKHPKLWKETVWGIQNYLPGYGIEEAISNRDRLANDYKLVRHLKVSISSVEIVDHAECYLAEDERAYLITSPYGDNYPTSFEQFGYFFKPIENIYHKTSKSYAITFQSAQALRSACLKFNNLSLAKRCKSKKRIDKWVPDPCPFCETCLLIPYTRQDVFFTGVPQVSVKIIHRDIRPGISVAYQCPYCERIWTPDVPSNAVTDINQDPPMVTYQNVQTFQL